MRSALSLIDQVARQRATRLSEEHAQREALKEIVSIVDGLPLALELATARLSLLSPTQLASRLRASPELLREDRRDRPERHRSLRATVQWTLEALGGAQRELFVRLGVFAGPVDLEEIEMIAGDDGLDVVSALSGLLDAALVRRIQLGDSRVQFGLPEALRQIASAMLDETSDAADWREVHFLRQHSVLWRARLRNACGAAEERAAAQADREAAAALRWAQMTRHSLADGLAVTRAGRVLWSGRLRECESLLEPLLACPPRRS